MAVYRFVTFSVDAVTAQPLPVTRVGMDAARSVTVSVEGADLRVRWDGMDPTTTVGHLVTMGDALLLDNADAIVGLRVIAASGTANLTVTLEGP